MVGKLLASKLSLLVCAPALLKLGSTYLYPNVTYKLESFLMKSFLNSRNIPCVKLEIESAALFSLSECSQYLSEKPVCILDSKIDFLFV